jgi:hypothetical protein
MRPRRNERKAVEPIVTRMQVECSRLPVETT